MLTPGSGGACLQFDCWMSRAAKRQGEWEREWRRTRRVGKRETVQPLGMPCCKINSGWPGSVCEHSETKEAWASVSSLWSRAWVLTGAVATSLCQWPSQDQTLWFPSALQWAEPYYESFWVYLRRTRASSWVCGRKLLADLWSSLPLSCTMVM